MLPAVSGKKIVRITAERVSLLIFSVSSIQSLLCPSFGPFTSSAIAYLVHYQVHLRSAHVPLSMRARIPHRIRAVRDALHTSRLPHPQFLRSSDPPQLPFPNSHYNLRELDAIDSPSLHFHTRTMSGGSLSDRMVVEPFVFVPTATELMQQAANTSADCVSGAASSSNATLAVPAKLKSRDGYRLSWHRPVDPPARSFG